jgi:hypothetical protein
MQLDDLLPLSFPLRELEPNSIDRSALARRVSALPIVRYTHRPFDVRWSCVAPELREYARVAETPNTWIVTGEAPLITRHLARGRYGARAYPLYRIINQQRVANLAPDAHAYLARVGGSESDLLHHLVTVVMTGAELTLPDRLEPLRESGLTGYRIATLFTSEPRLADHELRTIAVPARVGREARMLRGSVLAVADDWRVEHRDGACDIYLNDKAFWCNVPKSVWSYTHGGVPLLESWLRDRRASAIGRPLTREEVAHFSHAARRIALLLAALAQNCRNASSAVSAPTNMRLMPESQ